MLIAPVAGPVGAAHAQDPADSVLAQRAELDKALAASLDRRIPMLEKFLADYPDSLLGEQAREALVRSHASVGEAALKRSDPREASAAFRQALDAAGVKVSDRLFAVVRLMPAFMASSGYRFESIELMRAFEPRFEEQAARLVQIGFFYLSVESPDDAVRVLERATSLAPENHAAHTSLGQAYIMSLRLDDAAQEFIKAIELEPKEEFAYTSLANLRRATGNAAEAIDLYKKQLDVTPDSPEAFGGLAVAYLLNDQDAEASQALAQALALSPRDFQLYTQIAYYYVSRGRLDKAREMLDLSFNIQPRFSWTHIVRGNLLLAERQYLDALTAFREAENYGDFPTLHFESAKAYMMADRYDEAIDKLRAAFDLTETGEFETSLGDILTLKSSKLDLLLERERQAVLFMPIQPTTPTQYQLAESLARIGYYLSLIPDPELREVAPPEPAPATTDSDDEGTGEGTDVVDETLDEGAPAEGDEPEDDGETPEDGGAAPVGAGGGGAISGSGVAVAAQPPEQDPADGQVILTDPHLKPGDAPLVYRPRRASDRPRRVEPEITSTDPVTPTEVPTENGDPDVAVENGTGESTEANVEPTPPPFDPNGRPVDPIVRERLLSAVESFVYVDDGREPYRKLWIARQLARKGVLLDTAVTLAREALDGAETATVLERSIRDMPELKRDDRTKVLTARAQATLGNILRKRGELEESILLLERSVKSPEADPEYRNRLWQLAEAKEANGDEREALDLYVRAYDPSTPAAPVRKSIIERLYVKLNGSSDGLEKLIVQP